MRPILETGCLRATSIEPELSVEKLLRLARGFVESIPHFGQATRRLAPDAAKVEAFPRCTERPSRRARRASKSGSASSQKRMPPAEGRVTQAALSPTMGFCYLQVAFKASHMVQLRHLYERLADGTPFCTDEGLIVDALQLPTELRCLSAAWHLVFKVFCHVALRVGMRALPPEKSCVIEPVVVILCASFITRSRVASLNTLL